MQTHRGISKITVAGVKDVILISITAVCLLMIFAIFALLILVKGPNIHSSISKSMAGESTSGMGGLIVDNVN